MSQVIEQLEAAGEVLSPAVRAVIQRLEAMVSELRDQLRDLQVRVEEEEQARRDGSVRIRRRDGQAFVVSPEPAAGSSPLDVEGVGLEMPAEEVVAFVREGRRDLP